MGDFTVSDIVASLRETESNLRSMLYEKEAENQRLKEVLGVYANHDNWDTEAVALDMETGEFPDVNGNTPTVDIPIELGIPIIWNWSDEGYSLAEKTLKELNDA
jgi:hypothetical protein